jgi:phenylpropionate dioxygenase-like ring-hydroxylating dioxygenase large terminal subunit
MSELAAARTFALLESDYYTSDEIFAKEFERIFSREWFYACHLSQLPTKGSFVRFPFAGEEIVVVRGEGDAVYAHLNVCRHRGFRLCDEPSGKVRGGFTCPYHQWRFNLDGSLASVPQMIDGDYFDYKDYGLRTAHVEVWHGMVFLNLNAGPVQPVGDQLKAYDDVASKYAPERTKMVHEKQYELAANWKVAAENSLECYHCPGSHAALCRVVDVPGLQADLREWISDPEIEADGGASGMRIQAGMATLSSDGALITDKLLGEWGPADVAKSVSGGATIMPNLFYAAFYIDHWWTLTFRPVTPTTCVVLYQWFVREDAEPGVDFDIDRLIHMGHVTQSEDNALIERTQRGVESKYFTPGPLSVDLEAALHDFVTNYLKHMA